jgi:Homeodomain-like domain-containing protein
MKARCLETRALANGLKYRRYRRPDGSHFKTVEVPIEVWRGIAHQGREQDRLAQWQRARKRDALKARAIEMVKNGWKPLAAAHELSVPERTVQRWVQHGVR